MVDDVRRRVQQETLGNRGRKDDPLYGIRHTLQIGAEHPRHEVTLAWHCYQQVRSVYLARPEKGRQLVAGLLAAFPTCPIPEVARLGRTLRGWKSEILAYFDTMGASNGPPEAVNGVI